MLLLQLPWAQLAATLSFVIFIYILLKKRNTSTRQGHQAPFASGAWPLIGHLNLLKEPQHNHLVLGTMADKYGPIFTIQLGLKRALVVSNWELAKECLSRNKNSFANRPKTIALEHMGYNHAMFGFSPIGPYWRKMRRITAHELLSKQGLTMLDHILDSVVRTSITEIYDKWVEEKDGSESVMMDMKKWLKDVTLDVIFRVVVGKRLRDGNQIEGEKCQELIERFFELWWVFTYGDFIPFLRCLDLGGFEKIMKKTGEEMDIFLSRWLDEHKRNKSSSKDIVEQDFMSVLLSILEGDENEGSSFDSDTINKATCMVLIAGGVDSTTVTMIWALTLLINNPKSLIKAQDELDNHVGKGRQVKISDIENLTYLQAIIKETLRLHPPAQLSPPREGIEDCCVGGYTVTPGTRLYLNLWKIHRDPRVWSQPMEFRPERFLTTHKEVDVRGQSFEFLPFGSGQRVCVGITFSLRIMYFALASLLHSFKFTTLFNENVGNNVPNVDTSGTLQIRLAPRLASNIYR